MRTCEIASKQDGLLLHLVIGEPEGEVKGIVQISHGMSEHGGRYRTFMEFLCANGFAAVCHDHRGHGQSVRASEDLGYFYEPDGVAVVEDLRQVSTYIKEQFPGVPLVLFSHSMGTLVARCYLQKYGQELDGLVLCGPPCRNAFAKAGALGLRLYGKLRGEKHRSEGIAALMDKMFMKPFAGEESGSWICTDSGAMKKYRDDELCGFAFTINGYQNLLELLYKTYRQKDYQASRKDLPILFIAGEDDPVTGGEEKLKEQILFLKKAGYETIKWKTYKGKRHELLQEDIKETVFRDVLRWLEKADIGLREA